MVGVDAFFVISGFLITSLLLTEWRRDGHIHLGRFWMRRLRRIVPALIVATLVAVAAAVCVRGDVLLGVRRQVIGSATLVYNWVEIAAGSSYFDQAQPLLLTNVWSLAVEEQFYVVWPFVILILLRVFRRRGIRRAAWVAAALALASALWALILSLIGGGVSRVYMGTDTHAFGLMLGATLALWHSRATDGVAAPAAAGTGSDVAPRQPLTSARALWMRGVVGWLSLVALVLCARLGDDGADGGVSAGAPTLWLVAASLCAFGVVQAFTPEVQAFDGPGRWLASLLELRPLRWLGARSYGLYLWHWPLWVLAFYGLPRTWDHQVVTWAVLLASVLAAELSYHVIESPVRTYGLIGYIKQLRTSGPMKVLVVSLTTTALVLFVVMAFTLQPRHSSAQEAIEAGAAALASAQASATNAPSDSSTQGEPTPTAQATPSENATVPPVTGDQVELVGDSVSLASAGGLDEALPGIVVDAKVSRSFYAALPTLEEMDAQYGPRPYVVVSLVTNGTVTDELLQGLLDYLGPQRKLVLVTGYGPARTTWIPGANATLAAFAQAHPGQVAIADWNAAIAPHTDLLAEDQVHPGPEGGHIYASTVVDALNTLAGAQ